MKYRFSVDDNILFLKDIAERGYHSIFENEYLMLYKCLHEKYGLKVHLNLFYETDSFNLSDMPDLYKNEWMANANWIQLSFHSRREMPMPPYIDSEYEEVYEDCKLVQEQIIRFAGEKTLSACTTIHCCEVSEEGLFALRDAGIKGLVGLFGTRETPRMCYGLPYDAYNALYTRPYYYDAKHEMYFLNNHIVLNTVDAGAVEERLSPLLGTEFIEMMIHEQYYYKDYALYQPDFKEKICIAVEYLQKHGYESVFANKILGQ